MSALYLDTSALVKRYLAELGSGWIEALTDKAAGNVVIVSHLTTVELFSALARRQRESTLKPADALILQTRFLADFEREYLTIPLEKPVLRRARDLVSRYPLRSLDGIQLASALEAASILGEQLTFLTSDKNLLAIAASNGFHTDDPNNHA